MTIKNAHMSDSNTILVLGANAGQLDLIKYMQTIGWTVHACAHRRGDSGEKHADVFHLLDIRDIDAVCQLAQEIQADLVYSVSSDIAMITAVAVSTKLSLPHFFDNDLIDLLNRKELLRQHLNNHNLGPVEYQTIRKFDDIDNWTTFPCMVKPSDAQGQRGVQKVTKEADFEKAVNIALEASTSNTAIIEEFLDGVEMSCNILVNQGDIKFDILSERLVHGGDLFGIPEGHLVPCMNVSLKVQSEAIKLVHETIRSLKVESGCLYFQMKASHQGVRIIEIAPRLDGCHMWRLIKSATGEDFLASTVQCLLGHGQDSKRTVVPKKCRKELIFQQAPPNKKFDLESFPIPQDVVYHEYRYDDGDIIQPINGKMDVVGYYVRPYSQDEAQIYRQRIQDQ